MTASSLSWKDTSTQERAKFLRRAAQTLSNNPLHNGRLELLNYLHKQTISETTHRHGRVYMSSEQHSFRQHTPFIIKFGRALHDAEQPVIVLSDISETSPKCSTSMQAYSSAPPHYSLPIDSIFWFLTGGCFAILLSANPFDAFVASILSVLIFLIVRQTSSGPRWKPVATILGSLTAGFLASLAAAAGHLISGF